MITQIRFKNWRSLKDVTISDLTPITVLIGANSSGKTNIVDGLRFIHYWNTVDYINAYSGVRYRWGDWNKLRYLGSSHDNMMELTIQFDLDSLVEGQFTQKIEIDFSEHPDVPKPHGPSFSHSLLKNRNERLQVQSFPQTSSDMTGGSIIVGLSNQKHGRELITVTLNYFLQSRWQFLREGFSPSTVLTAEGDPGDLFRLSEDGRNLVYVLDNMRLSEPEIFDGLVEDAQWLMSHIDEVNTKRADNELRIALREPVFSETDAPTISAGTSRLIAVLAANYVLDMDRTQLTLDGAKTTQANELPALIVIEEPDTALNPGLFRKFVEQLRNYSEGEHPRQFILTTHNPSLLDYFQPEEVRVVERDERGFTTVNRIPEQIKDIWLGDHTLGEVWLTRTLGGVPE